MHSVLNVKALLGSFNQEKALVGAFYVIVKTDCETVQHQHKKTFLHILPTDTIM